VVLIGLTFGAGLFAVRWYDYVAHAQALRAAGPDQAIEQNAPNSSGVKSATDFRWTAAPTDDLSAPGLKAVHLSRCAPGVSGTNRYYWVYISGTGAAEAVLVTGGTCAGDSKSGTLSFTTVRGHPAGYTISSATGGIQEASQRVAIIPEDAKRSG